MFAGAGGAGAGCAGAVLVPAGAGCAGAVFVGAGRFVDLSSSTVAPRPAFRVAMIDKAIEVIMNSTAEIVVAFDSSVAEPRGPNAVCEPMPPNAPATSEPFELCSSTERISTTAVKICITVNKVTISMSLSFY